MSLKILLTAFKEKPLLEAWKKYADPIVDLAKKHDVELIVHDGSILDLQVDSIVSPANSFGFMRGGIDGIYTKKFGLVVEKAVQKLIQEHHYGEMLVGEAEVVETENKSIPFCISAPTMRIGTTLEETTTNPFLAARAVFLLWKHGTFKYGDHKGEEVKKVIKEIAFPGLGTGVGGVSYEACAFQVIKALRLVIFGEFEFPKHGQPKDDHHEMWQIDKPISTAKMQMDYLNSYLNDKNPKAMASLYCPDSVVTFQNDSYKGQPEILKFYDDYFKQGIKKVKLDISDIKPLDDIQILVTLEFKHNCGTDKCQMVYKKYPVGDWRIVKHSFA